MKGKLALFAFARRGNSRGQDLRTSLAAALIGTLAGAAVASQLDTLLPDAFGEVTDAELAGDPLRPTCHLLPARGWMNDPCGPIFWKGKYHMFFQYNPHAAVWGDMHWNHAVSDDMVHWRRLPVALAPTPGGPDADGCFTGSAVVLDGKPTFLYTGVQAVTPEQATLRDEHSSLRESQCLAIAADDSLVHWIKQPAPVIPKPPADMKVTGFRDPAPFRLRGSWYTLIGSGIAARGGMVLLYRSDDMRTWEYLHPLISGTWRGQPGTNPVDTGEMWECPDFFPLGEKYVLIHSTEGKTYWQVGRLDQATMLFHAETTGLLDYGDYYAPKTQLDEHGNRILWGWIRESRPEAEYSRAGWAGLMSLPRLITVENGRLHMQPAAPVAQLRSGPSQALTQSSMVPSGAWEVMCLLQQGTSPGMAPHEIRGQQRTYLALRTAKQAGVTLKPGTWLVNGTELPMAGHAADIELRLFVDHSVAELCIGREHFYTRRFYAPDASPIITLTTPDDIHPAVASLYPLAAIW